MAQMMAPTLIPVFLVQSAENQRTIAINPKRTAPQWLPTLARYHSAKKERKWSLECKLRELSLFSGDLLSVIRGISPDPLVQVPGLAPCTGPYPPPICSNLFNLGLTLKETSPLPLPPPVVPTVGKVSSWHSKCLLGGVSGIFPG